MLACKRTCEKQNLLKTTGGQEKQLQTYNKSQAKVIWGSWKSDQYTSRQQMDKRRQRNTEASMHVSWITQTANEQLLLQKIPTGGTNIPWNGTCSMDLSMQDLWHKRHSRLAAWKLARRTLGTSRQPIKTSRRWAILSGGNSKAWIKSCSMGTSMRDSWQTIPDKNKKQQ